MRTEAPALVELFEHKGRTVVCHACLKAPTDADFNERYTALACLRCAPPWPDELLDALAIEYRLRQQSMEVPN